MARVMATMVGYYGGEIRDAGEEFDIPDEVLKDKRRRPSWVSEVESAATRGPAEDLQESDIPTMTVLQMQEFAAQRGIDLGPALRKSEVRSKIERALAEPVALASAEGVAMVGGAQPDWVSPLGGQTVDGKPSAE